ncbi:MAG: ACT domain-containing protein, partial [Synergistes sp.]|nr:ACT domain-containing protein [Synergistes sp.]
LRGESYEHAVNLPFIEQALNAGQRKFLNLARKLGILAAKFALLKGAPAHRCHVTLRGPLFDDEEKNAANRLRPYTIAVLKGMLEVSIGTSVTYMLAPLLAKDRGISIDESSGEPVTYKNTIEVELETAKGPVSLTATITEEGRQRIVRVNDYWVDFVPSGKLLLFQNHDRPGVIGKLGSLLGAAQVNIASFALGRKEGSGLAFGALEIDGETDESLLKKLTEDGDLVWVTTVDFTKA